MKMKNSALNGPWSTSRSSLIATWRTSNTVLDYVFYDTDALSAEERASLSAHTDPLGSILVVHPGASRKPIHPMTPLQFVEEQQGKPAEAVSALVVAGVGSSALGTAALARDVADYLGRPVAGIVSGLGLADVAAEALGGWFVFGATNVLRDALARGLDVFVQDHVRDQKTHDAMKQHFQASGLDPEFFIYGSPDSTALLYVLSKLGSKIKLLVGHSKGNYSIENALEGWRQMTKAPRTPIPADLQIVTLSAVIWFPPQFAHVRQVIGQIDWFGMLNSRPDVNYLLYPGAWHTLNRDLLGHLPVAQALKLAGIQSRPLANSALPNGKGRGKQARLNCLRVQTNALVSN